MTFFGHNVWNVNPLKSSNRQECKVKPEITNINSNEALVYR